MDSLFTLFLLPTFAGYLILAKTQLYSVSSDGLTATVLFIESFAYGLGILYLSYVFLALSSGHAAPILENEAILLKASGFNPLNILQSIWQFMKWPINNEICRTAKITQESIFTIFIAAAYVAISNCELVKNSERYKEKMMAKRDKTDSLLEGMLYHAMNTLTPLQITLRNRKVYIGVLIAMPEKRPSNKQDQFLELLPLKSGYRNAETLKIEDNLEDYSFMMQLMLDNAKEIKNLEEIPFNIAPDKKAAVNASTLVDSLSYGIFIDMGEIISVSLWDGAIFKKFKHDHQMLGKKEAILVNNP